MKIKNQHATKLIKFHVPLHAKRVQFTNTMFIILFLLELLI